MLVLVIGSPFGCVSHGAWHGGNTVVDVGPPGGGTPEEIGLPSGWVPQGSLQVGS
jgi:hypothetical protein